MNSPRFNWIVECRNTIKELRSTFVVPTAIARELQKMIARGATEQQCFAVSAASKELREQVGN